MTCSTLLGLVLLSQPVDEFDAFEQPQTLAVLPLEAPSADAREAEAWLTRLLIESKRYRVMPTWEVRERLTEVNPESAAKALGVASVLTLRMRGPRSLELQWLRDPGPSPKAQTARIGGALVDRDLATALERLGMLRTTYRVPPPFSVRRGDFARAYGQTVAYLQSAAHDPSEKLAAAEAFLVAFSTRADPRVGDIQVARSKLLSGRAFLDPVTDEVCQKRSDCERFGLCRGGPVACVARADRECRRSEVCKVDGRCLAIGGECQAGGPSCEHAYSCAAEGRCEPRAARCMVPDSRACESSTQCTEVQACTFRFGLCT
ncbi:MAG: hypothetical protein AAFX94_20240, partial [Myxococcota bacterium]